MSLGIAATRALTWYHHRHRHYNNVVLESIFIIITATADTKQNTLTPTAQSNTLLPGSIENTTMKIDHVITYCSDNTFHGSGSVQSFVGVVRNNTIPYITSCVLSYRISTTRKNGYLLHWWKCSTFTAPPDL